MTIKVDSRSFNLPGSETKLSFITAFKSDDVEEVKKLLKANPNSIRERDDTGETLLHKACRKSISKDIIEQLIAAGADVNALNWKEECALELLIAKCDKIPTAKIYYYEMINALLFAGSDLRLVQNNRVYLIAALMHESQLPEYSSALKKVLAQLSRQEYEKWLPALLAIALNVVKDEELKKVTSILLISQEKNAILACGKASQTRFEGLVEACQRGDVKSVEQLLGFDLRLAVKQDSSGNTPLLMACLDEQYAVAVALIEWLSPAALDIRNNEGECALSILAQAKKPPVDAICYLVVRGANPRINGRVGIMVVNSMLKKWDTGGFIDVFKNFIEAGFNLNLRDLQNQLPVQVALNEISNESLLKNVLTILLQNEMCLDLNWLRFNFRSSDSCKALKNEDSSLMVSI